MKVWGIGSDDVGSIQSTKESDHHVPLEVPVKIQGSGHAVAWSVKVVREREREREKEKERERKREKEKERKKWRESDVPRKRDEVWGPTQPSPLRGSAHACCVRIGKGLSLSLSHTLAHTPVTPLLFGSG